MSPEQSEKESEAETAKQSLMEMLSSLKKEEILEVLSDSFCPNCEDHILARFRSFHKSKNFFSLLFEFFFQFPYLYCLFLSVYIFVCFFLCIYFFKMIFSCRFLSPFLFISLSHALVAWKFFSFSF